jgi:GH15 family glucan-1,4-alpha-glucosidase
MPRRQDDLRLADYAVIGDGVTAALVSADGSVDWLCHDRFDGPAVFCRILDARRGGYFQVAPVTAFRSTRRYLEHTNVIVTDFECATGKARLTDCMPFDARAKGVILRKLDGLSGKVEIGVDFFPTFDFARTSATIELHTHECWARARHSSLRLRCPAPMKSADCGASTSFRIDAGQTSWVVLTDEPPDDGDAARALQTTVNEWQRWSAHGHYPRSYEAAVRRSALVLKLLIHSPSGAMVAAPTTSLPEIPGGSRNWDYRFTWLRDASWLVSALMDLGYHDESMAFIGWLEGLALEKTGPSVLYDVDGHRPVAEEELTHLSGYRRGHPIRIGNAAAAQDQHDLFGEIVCAIFACSEAMPSMRPLRPGLWSIVAAMANRAAERWPHPDRGIWEVRDRPRHFVSSKLLCWTALDRALVMARRDYFSGPLQAWEVERDRIRNAIVEHGFDSELGAFRRAFGKSELDSSALLLPRYGLLPHDEPRVARTVRAIRERLSAGNGLLRRYVLPDGLPGNEGAFAACSFWLAECLARQGRRDDAHVVFEQVTAHAGDLGLLSEEIDPQSGELLGNYPQVFTHLALIRAAVAIDEAEHGPRTVRSK